MLVSGCMQEESDKMWRSEGASDEMAYQVSRHGFNED